MRRPLIALLALSAFPVSAAAAPGAERIGPADGNFDVRAGRAVAPANPAAVDRLRARLGADATVAVEPSTGGLREVGRLNGLLTGPSRQDPAAIAIGYVRRNRAAFGLTRADVDGLVLVRRIRSGNGLQRLFWQQRSNGVPALGSGLRANFTADGRLIGLAGSPVSGIRSVAVAPQVDAAQARVAAYAGLDARVRPSLARVRPDARRTTTFASGERAALGVVAAGRARHLVWDTTVRVAPDRSYRVLVDAATGRTLVRRTLVQHVTARVHLNYPGAPVGGAEATVTLDPSWIGTGAPNLSGPNAHAWADLNDNDLPDTAEEIAPSGGNFSYPLTVDHPLIGGTPPGVPGAACSPVFPCTWDPTAAGATRAQNKDQSGAQVFFFVNNFHDWLARPPISFTNTNGAFRGADPVQAQVLDGAALDDPGPPAVPGPDLLHIDNANMETDRDGIPPTMQMYLFHFPGMPWSDPGNGLFDPFLAANGGDEADIVYHEYTHGLSNRLVIDANGDSTLISTQAASMGEAWSDWYAMDFLASTASCSGTPCFTDTPAPGDLRIGRYVAVGTVGPLAIRTQAVDCPVAAANPGCASPGPGVRAGGYTYASFGSIAGVPEVHADGEIWVQTLWDLRTAVTAPVARMLITRAMELSPDDPTYLDMRNGILQADTAFNGGAAHGRIWAVFAHRGMGYFAGTIDGNDSHPVASFALPPAGTPTAVVTGKVIDRDSHAPLRGALVGLSGVAGGPSSAAGATGRFRLPPAFAAVYPYLVARRSGFESGFVRRFRARAGRTATTLTPRRGWALASGGGQVVNGSGPDFSEFGCGPDQLIDGSLDSGWGTLKGSFIVVRLPHPVDVADVAVDPGAICFDPPSAATRKFTIETSRDGRTFRAAATGSFRATDGGRVHPIRLTAGSKRVRFVRFTARTNFGEPNGLTDVAELQVHGLQASRAVAVISGPTFIELGRMARFRSTSSQGPDGSPIVRRSWKRHGAPTARGGSYAIRGRRVGQLFRVTLTVRDFAGRVGSRTRSFRVRDTLGPHVTLATAGARVSRPVAIRGRVSDPSGISARVTVRFGDGRSQVVTVRHGRYGVRHTYRATGAFTITVTATDRRHNTSRTARSLTIH